MKNIIEENRRLINLMESSLGEQDGQEFPDTAEGAIAALKYMASPEVIDRLDFDTAIVEPDPDVGGVWSITFPENNNANAIMYLPGFQGRTSPDMEDNFDVLFEAPEYDDGSMGDSIKDHIIELFGQFYDLGEDGLDKLDSIDLYRELSDRYSYDIEEMVAQAAPSELASLKREMEFVLDDEISMKEARRSAADRYDHDKMVKFDADRGVLIGKMIAQTDRKSAVKDGWRDTHDGAMRAAGYMPSKFKAGEYIRKGVDGKWEKIIPYANKNESLSEKAVSKSQQQAAGAALAAKRGEIPASELVGASKEMYDGMTEKELEDFAGTKHKGLPDKKESVNEFMDMDGSYGDKPISVQVKELLDRGERVKSTVMGAMGEVQDVRKGMIVVKYPSRPAGVVNLDNKPGVKLVNKQDHYEIVHSGGLEEGYTLKKANVSKYTELGDPDEWQQDINVKDIDYEIINNKTGKVVGTASWSTNDYFGPGAMKITMKNGATRWLDVRLGDDPQSAFNKFVKNPKTSKKYKDHDGLEEGYTGDSVYSYGDSDHSQTVSYNVNKREGDASINISATASDLAELKKILDLAGVDVELPGAEQHDVVPDQHDQDVISVDMMPDLPIDDFGGEQEPEMMQSPCDMRDMPEYDDVPGYEMDKKKLYDELIEKLNRHLS